MSVEAAHHDLVFEMVVKLAPDWNQRKYAFNNQIPYLPDYCIPLKVNYNFIMTLAWNVEYFDSLFNKHTKLSVNEN